MFKRNSTPKLTAQDKLIQTIGRLEHSIEVFPRNKELVGEQLDAAYAALGRLAYPSLKPQPESVKPVIKTTFANA